MNEIPYHKTASMKISVVGSTSVGKTSICTRIVNNFFTGLYEPTIDIQ